MLGPGQYLGDDVQSKVQCIVMVWLRDFFDAQELEDALFRHESIRDRRESKALYYRISKVRFI